ncbi:MAG: lipoate--protein ligase [Spirochaetes bacterium]|jgi:lipoate-protein ligase A|nr:lipoate--protein ligase [Spirochaetota bacterium]
MSVRIFTSESNNPWFNLATEDWIFRDMDPSYRILFLWRNADTVVIGRHQNPWKECNLEKMERDGVYLARRQSGGGAVYQDLGNTNFTFMTSLDQYDQEENFGIIINALAEFGITAERSGRNDVLVDGRKVSGSAFKRAKDRAFHHGTLLIGADLGRLVDYLSPAKKKLVSKGIESVKSRVANLTEFNEGLDHDTLTATIIKTFLEHHGEEAEVEHLTRDDLAEIPSLAAHFEELKDWNWRFGRSPDFSHHMNERFDWGEMDVHLETKRGHISEIAVFSDTLHPEMVEYLEQHMVGLKYEKDDLRAFFDTMKTDMPDVAELTEEFGAWLVDEI